MQKSVRHIVDFDRPVRPHSDSMKWNRYAGSGPEVLPAWVADMDFLTPAPVRDAVQQRLQGAPLGYAEAPQALLEVFRARMQRLYGWQVEQEWVVVIPGVVPGLFGAVRTAGNAGDAVITQTPNYHHFFGAAEFSAQQLLPLPNHLQGGRWEMDFDQLPQLAGQGARSFLLCNPHNPLGRVLTRRELSQVAEFCLQQNLLICSDEIHAELILDEDKQHIPLASLAPEVAAKTITLVSPSKAFNLPGIGAFALAVIPDASIRGTFAQRIYGLAAHPGALSYAAALAAWRDCDDWLGQLLQYLRGNRDVLEQRIGAMTGISMAHVEATYLAWLDVSALELENPFQHFLAHGVALSDGTPMGDRNFLRLNFGTTRANLEQILSRMERALGAG
ncbi:MalY/PatB family protein [Seongchinamella unica]|uniref:MalY/PatB family protein n=1 Tax=Seongchinamella unica TaxID=2547392 RepID=UPI0014046E4E|nr:PatB family C-S lyase [Seongchinamella unica]